MERSEQQNPSGEAGHKCGTSGEEMGAAGRMAWVEWTRWGILARVLVFRIGCVCLLAADPKVSNVRVEARPRPMEYAIRYDVEPAEGERLTVRLAVSEDGGRTFQDVSAASSGDVGKGVPPGKDRRMVWRGPVTWLGDSRRELRFRVVAANPQPMDEMVRIAPGRFTMGSPDREPGRDRDEGPVTEVTFTHGFWMGRYEVTQSGWEAVMTNNPSKFKGNPELPVENVSWEEAMEFCRRVTRREDAAGRLPGGYEYRLPTEAEWEFACRAGTRTATAFGDQLDSTRANFDGDYPYNGAAKGPNLRRTSPVGSYAANAWGLHDMHGNVWEWCRDWYDGRLMGGTVTNPAGPTSGSLRVYRGGSWLYFAALCRSSARYRNQPTFRNSNLGFRLACGPAMP